MGSSLVSQQSLWLVNFVGWTSREVSLASSGFSFPILSFFGSRKGNVLMCICYIDLVDGISWIFGL